MGFTSPTQIEPGPWGGEGEGRDRWTLLQVQTALCQHLWVWLSPTGLTLVPSLCARALERILWLMGGRQSALKLPQRSVTERGCPLQPLLTSVPLFSLSHLCPSSAGPSCVLPGPVHTDLSHLSFASLVTCAHPPCTGPGFQGLTL